MAASDTSSLTPNTVVGNYRLLGQIGRGGMGTVYRAEQLTMQREVAVKVLNPRKVRDPKSIESFIREAKIAASLSHHHLVPIYDVGFDQEHQVHFYAMKYVKGRTLSTVVAQEGPLSVGTALGYIEQAATAMGHAHNQGVVHRDLKPANIILSENDEAVVTDLGSAIDRLAGQAATSKRVLKLVGTAEYAAPEQLRNPDKATAAADVWGLGATLYFLLTGSEPFSGETLLDLVVSVATEDPEKLLELPAPIQHLLSQLMAKDPEDRPANGGEIKKLLESMRGGSTNSAAAVPTSRRRRQAPVARVTSRRRRR